MNTAMRVSDEFIALNTRGQMVVEGAYPLVPGVHGVGLTEGGQRVLFLLPEAPFGAMAERTRVRIQLCVPIQDGIDDVTGRQSRHVVGGDTP